MVFLLQIVEIIRPDIICHIPHQAAINAIPPIPSNSFGLNIRTNANPEFCIPVSIDMVLLSILGSLKTIPREYPVTNAIRLCANTNRIIR